MIVGSVGFVVAVVIVATVVVVDVVMRAWYVQVFFCLPNHFHCNTVSKMERPFSVACSVVF